MSILLIFYKFYFTLNKNFVNVNFNRSVGFFFDFLFNLLYIKYILISYQTTKFFGWICDFYVTNNFAINMRKKKIFFFLKPSF